MMLRRHAGRVIDAERMMVDLRRAAFEIDQAWTADDEPAVFEHQGMARAWRIVIAAVEDGDYDAAPGREEGS